MRDYLIDGQVMLCEKGNRTDLTNPKLRKEKKWDGTRGKGGKTNGKPDIVGRDRDRGASRYGSRGSLPDLMRDITKFPDNTVVDMEIIWRNELGIPTFKGSQTRCSTHKPTPILIEQYPVTGMCFDLLALKGEDLTGKPYFERKALVKEFLEQGGFERLEYSVDVADATEIWNTQVAKGLMEGVIAKVENSTYSFMRSNAWHKLKWQQDIVADVVGYDMGEGKRSQMFGHLVVAVNGKYIGEVGPGHLTDSESRLLTAYLKAQPIINKPFFTGEPYVAIKTELKVDITFHRFTETGVMRFPVLNRVLYPKQTVAVAEDELLKPAFLRAMSKADPL